MTVTKKKREHKTSKGEHGGGGKVRLSYIQKILLGGGALRTVRKKEPEQKGTEREQRINRG